MNKYANMEIVALEDITDIYDSIGIELMELDSEKDYIAVYGKRDLICELFEMMITDGYSFRYADCDFMDEALKDRVYMMFVRQDCGVSIEPAHCSNGTPTMHDAKTAFIFMDDCKQDVIDYCVKSDKNVVLFDYEDERCGCEECQCACKEGTDDKVDYDVKSDDDGYSITVRCNLDADEAMKVIKDMENRMKRMNDMFREMDEWRKLFRW